MKTQSIFRGGYIKLRSVTMETKVAEVADVASGGSTKLASGPGPLEPVAYLVSKVLLAFLQMVPFALSAQ